MKIGDDVWVLPWKSETPFRARVVFIGVDETEFCGEEPGTGKIAVFGTMQVITEARFEKYRIDTLRREICNRTPYATPEQLAAAWDALNQPTNQPERRLTP